MIGLLSTRCVKLFIASFLLLSLPSCEQGQQHDVGALSTLSTKDDRFSNASENNKISFPKDHFPQKDFRHEWWYLTANLQTEDNKDIAVQWTLFRTAVNDKHWYFAHAAMADAQTHLSAFRDGREAFATVQFAKSPFAMRIDDWQWQSSGELLPATLNFGNDKSDETSWKAKLNLHSNLALESDLKVGLENLHRKGFFLQGQNGYNRKHPSLDIASHYYSQPFIKVNGQIYWQGRWQNVSGDAWFDREWSSQFLGKEQQGWDWFSLRLNKDIALMVYRIRSEGKDHQYGNLMHRNGWSQRLESDDIEIENPPSKHQSYPNVFQVKVRQYDINLNVKVINKKQINQFGIEYFEGMVSFSGSHQGKGFVEMTGYR